MTYRMCNYDFDVAYQGLSQSIRHTEKCSYAYPDDKEVVDELIQMAEIVNWTTDKDVRNRLLWLTLEYKLNSYVGWWE